MEWFGALKRSSSRSHPSVLNHFLVVCSFVSSSFFLPLPPSPWSHFPFPLLIFPFPLPLYSSLPFSLFPFPLPVPLFTFFFIFLHDSKREEWGKNINLRTNVYPCLSFLLKTRSLKWFCVNVFLLFVCFTGETSNIPILHHFYNDLKEKAVWYFCLYFLTVSSNRFQNEISGT